MTEIRIPPVADSPGDAAAQSAQAHCGALWFDLAQRTHVAVCGADRARFLHNFCTNDVRGLAPGDGCEAFVTSVQGKILAHVFLYARADALSISTVPGCAERLIAHLSRYQITEDVSFLDETPSRRSVLIAGPRALSVVGALFGSPRALEGQRHADLPWGDGSAHLRRNDMLGLTGFECVVPADSLPRLTAALVGLAGQGGVAAFESLRIAAGFPWYGVDLSEANLAQEAARSGRAIHFGKGCYLGQEPIARIDALGHVNQELRVVQFADGSPPPPGSDLAGEGENAKVVGHVTSSAVDYAAGGVVCLALLRRSHLACGARVVCVEGGQPRAGTVSGVLPA